MAPDCGSERPFRPACGGLSRRELPFVRAPCEDRRRSIRGGRHGFRAPAERPIAPVRGHRRRPAPGRADRGRNSVAQGGGPARFRGRAGDRQRARKARRSARSWRDTPVSLAPYAGRSGGARRTGDPRPRRRGALQIVIFHRGGPRAGGRRGARGAASGRLRRARRRWP